MCLEREALPHHNTYRRILAYGVYREEIDGLVGEYNQGGLHGKVYALDGKAIRGMCKKDEESNEYLLSIYDVEQAKVMSQVEVGCKENEITKAPQALAQVYRLERQFQWRRNGRCYRTSNEVKFGITSLTRKEVSPLQLLHIRRAHWGIETGSHYRRDVTLKEDITRMTTGQMGKVMASLNKLVLALIRQAHFQNAAQARRWFAAHIHKAFALLTTPFLDFGKAMHLRDLWLDAFKRSWQNTFTMLNKLPSLARAVYKSQKLIYEYWLIRNSGLFDKSWYLEKNPEVAQAKVNPLIHYLRYGGFEGRDPNPNFSSKWYLEKNPDVAQARVNPLVHYLRYGGLEGRDPSPGFSGKWYLDTYEDVRKTGVNPLLHFLKYGKKEGRKIYPSQTLIWPPLDLSKISWGNIQFDPIVVHNMGKVGSQTVKLSLTKAYEALGVVAPVYFTHALNSFELGRQIAAQESHQRDPKSRLVALEAGEAIRKKIDSDPSQHWNIVSLVRDPIARNVAAFFQNLQEYIPDWSERYAEGKLNAHEVQAVYMKVSPSFDDLDQFFDSQMKAIPAFAIDVYETPFPHDRGYKIFPGKSQASLLLIRLENMNECIQQAMQEFLGFKDFTLHNTNVAGEKDYAPLYRAFKEIPLPAEYVDRIYKTQFARHFYSDAELEAFTRRWKHGVEKTRKNTSLNNAPA